jgi:hypothetical protein
MPDGESARRHSCAVWCPKRQVPPPLWSTIEGGDSQKVNAIIELIKGFQNLKSHKASLGIRSDLKV